VEEEVKFMKFFAVGLVDQGLTPAFVVPGALW
jgi:hypothetical protein